MKKVKTYRWREQPKRINEKKHPHRGGTDVWKMSHISRNEPQNEWMTAENAQNYSNESWKTARWKKDANEGKWSITEKWIFVYIISRKSKWMGGEWGKRIRERNKGRKRKKMRACVTKMKHKNDKLKVGEHGYRGHEQLIDDRKIGAT